VGTSGLHVNVTLTNSGTATLRIASVTTSSADFGSASACGSSVEPGASCTINIFFDPTAAGTRTGTLIITDNTSDSPQIVTLAGIGQDFTVTSTPSTATITAGQAT